MSLLEKNSELSKIQNFQKNGNNHGIKIIHFLEPKLIISLRLIISFKDNTVQARIIFDDGDIRKEERAAARFHRLNSLS